MGAKPSPPTAGPWNGAATDYCEQHPYSYCYLVVGPDGLIVAHALGETEEEASAKAKLIASAPDLADEVERLRAELSEARWALLTVNELEGHSPEAVDFGRLSGQLRKAVEARSALGMGGSK